jgi:integrase|tara:strand:- start:318 stop:1706 length:1389 start_codon:yes stop_codon:yes gene_type:complete
MKEENKKPVRKHVERRVRFSDTYIKSLRGRNKLYSKGDSEQPGLRIYVQPSGSMTFYYAYKPLNEKNWVRFKIGNFNVINVVQARNKAKKYAAAILEGKDPVLVKRELKHEPTLIEFIEDDFYVKRLLRSFGYKPSSVKTIKNYFKCWIKQKTTDVEIRQVQKDNPFSLQHKKLSTITPEDIRKLHNIIGIKSPVVADKTIDYLKVLFNYAIELKLLHTNPVTIKNKERFGDKEDNRILTKEQKEIVLKIVWKLDKRTGKLNYNYYKSMRLSMVACCIIAFWLTTPRRNISEGNSIRWKQISFPTKKIAFGDSKVGQMTYDLGPRTLEILKVIYGERLTEGPLKWRPGTKEYVFPSNRYGMKNSLGEINKTPYVKDIRKTWARILKMINVEYMPPKQTRHTVLTHLLSSSKNIMVVKEAAGHKNLKTTMRYAKILNEDVVSALEKMDQVEEKKSEVLEFKKQ